MINEYIQRIYEVSKRIYSVYICMHAPSKTYIQVCKIVCKSIYE